MTHISELGVDAAQVIRVFGMRRSGNHAIINWLTRNVPGRSLFFNNCRVGQNPFWAHNGIEVDGQQVARPGSNARATALDVGDGATVFVSYENTMPPGDAKKPISAGVDDALFDKQVIIARDFLNWSASLIKKLQGNTGFSAPQRMAFALRLLDTYGKMLNLVTHARENALIVIRYGDWYADATYRDDVLNRLGFDARDDDRNRVEAYGKGSSFQPNAQAATELRPLDRWKSMYSDPEYRMFVWLAGQDDALLANIDQVFPENIGPLGDLNARPPCIND